MYEGMFQDEPTQEADVVDADMFDDMFNTDPAAEMLAEEKRRKEEAEKRRQEDEQRTMRMMMQFENRFSKMSLGSQFVSGLAEGLGGA